MSGPLAIALVVWVGSCCLIAVAMVRVAALADRREHALRREALLDERDRVRARSGRRFVAPGDESPVTAEALRDVIRTSAD